MVCIICGDNKSENMFDMNRKKCKKCRSIESRDRHRTKKGIVSRIYNTQKTNSKKRGHRNPEYTREELQEWLFSQKLFHELYSEWKESGYLKRLKPSVDRKHDGIHYCMSNIQLMTWAENKNKAHKDSRTDKLATGFTKRPVRQLSLGGEIVAEFISCNEAARTTGFKGINDALRRRNGHNRSNGFLWEYVRNYDGVKKFNK